MHNVLCASMDATEAKKQKQELARKRALQALELRKAGYSYAKIKDALKYGSTRAVHYSLRRALSYSFLAETTDNHRALELERLDVLMAKCNQIISLTATAKRQDGERNPFYQDFELLFKAMDRVLVISARRSKMLGLDMPPQTAVLMAEYQKLFDQFSKLVNEVGALIVKEAPPDVAQRIIAKIAAFQTTSAAASANANHVANVVGRDTSETSLHLTQVIIDNGGIPLSMTARGVGPDLESVDIEQADSELPGLRPPTPPPDGMRTDGDGRPMPPGMDGLV